jgi:hypothetical protein
MFSLFCPELENSPEASDKSIREQMQTQPADSSYQAKAILGAWQTGDENRLRTELERVTVVKYKGLDSGEVERLELLCEIARELRSSSEALTSDSSSVYCSLLEHLAYSGKQFSGPRPVTPIWRYERAAAVTVLQ